jgi:Fic family protein
MSSYYWKPIEDLPGNWSELSSTELEGLATVWKDNSGKLKTRKSLKQFNEQLSREWAIETGIIENIYSIDRGTTQILIEKGIEASLMPFGTTDKPPDQIVLILKDHEDVFEGLFDFVSQRRALSTSYIKELHHALTRHQHTVHAVDSLGQIVETQLLHGEWKKDHNNPTRPSGELHEYCPPLQVSSEMDRLVNWHNEHIEKDIPPEIEAAWLHHRFTQIHPFQDGNGRVARALASLVFLQAGLFPLVLNRDNRTEYIDALEKADFGDLSPLVRLFSSIQKRVINKALSLSDDILHTTKPLERVITAAIEKLRARNQGETTQTQLRSIEIATELQKIASDRFNEIANRIDQQFKLQNPSYKAYVELKDKDDAFGYVSSTEKVAKELGYYANTRTYGFWLTLNIHEERLIQLTASFHALGVEPVGVMAVSAFISFWQVIEASSTIIASVGEPTSMSEEPFQFSYDEQDEEVIKRFNPWIDNVLIIGLDYWRRHL